MPKNIKEERLRWILPIYKKEVKLADVAKVCPHSKRSLERWLAAYRKEGEKGLEPHSTRPKTNPRETPLKLRRYITAVRKETKLSALKLSWKLKKEGISLHHRTIGKIIKREGLTRKYRVRKIKYKYVKTPFLPGELVEIDIKYVPQRVANRQYYQFTAIDSATRWRLMKIYDNPSSYHALLFLQELREIAPFLIRAIKTDNEGCFTHRYNGGYVRSSALFPKEHAFTAFCRENNIIHYLIDPGKPQQNGKVERSHRTDQEYFYDRIKYKSIEELKYQLKLWNMYYNDLEHCALNGKSPNDLLAK